MILIIQLTMVDNQVIARTQGSNSENIEEVKIAKEKVELIKEAGLVDCANFFSHFAPPATGYVRYKNNITCSSIDYPNNWYIDKDSIKGFNVILTDGKSGSIIISQRPAHNADNSTWFTLEDVKRAIILHDASIPNLANIPSLYEFQISVIGDGNFLDHLPSIRADALIDFGVYKNNKKLICYYCY